MNRTRILKLGLYLSVMISVAASGVLAQPKSSAGNEQSTVETLLKYEDDRRPDAPFPRPGVDLKEASLLYSSPIHKTTS